LTATTTRPGAGTRLAGLIAMREEARKDQGPVLVLDAGDYSMGTLFGAATREIGGELRLMSRMGYYATTFGNHEFDLGPDGLGKSISVASKAGRIPAVLASNTSFAASDAALADLQRLSKEGVIRRYLVIERGGMRFGLRARSSTSSQPSSWETWIAATRPSTSAARTGACTASPAR
jgi:5'-nucleotidase / UDP-sugar diphosphatase